MTLNIYKASDVKKNPHLDVMVYGPPGVGKTTFAATAPKPIILSMESGLQSITDTDAMCVDVHNMNDFSEAIRHATNNGYETIVFDSLTRYCEIKLDQIVRDARKTNSRITKPRIQDFGELGVKVKELIWSLKSKPINTVFICLQKEITDEEGKISKRPDLMGKLVEAVPGIMDVVGYMRVKPNGTRVLSINPTDKWHAKHRKPKDDKINEDLVPDFGILKDRLFPELKNKGAD